MSKIDYQALRAKAEKATCGVWSIEYGEERFNADDALIHREVAGYIPICRIEGAHPESGFYEDFQMEQQANAEFIAAANPATVLALLGELETAKKRIAELEAEPVSQTYKLNQLSGNSPVTPDGWISCSERMPEMGERQCYVLAADFKNNYPPNIPNTQVGVYGDWFNDGNPTWDDGDGEDLYLKEVTHWMPLPEPPQEVK
ncbi:ead/Ea22-like family protein [Escherichia coli]|uniref:ead/Ea22-like family protein n=1 Tax=Escherichia coli TaxID=562 RepID=UPI000BE5125B|nr:ead/Ea22-like family protein [Escherichia coli]